MVVALLLQLQIKINRFRLVEVTYEKNFGFSLTFFLH
jgi:hypothetical protein